MNKQDKKKMIEPPIKNQDDLIKILDLLNDLQDKNTKDKFDEIKNQIKKDLGIDQKDDDKYNYYIVDNKLRIDRLIIDGKIAEMAITNIDELMEHQSTARLNIQLEKDTDISYTKNCCEDLIRYVFYENDGRINDVYFKYEEMKNFKLVFSDGALKNTKYIFYLPNQIENLKNITYNNLEDLQKHICYKSICSHSDFKDFIRSKTNSSSEKLNWQTKDFDFLSRLMPNYGAVNNFDILSEVVNFDDKSVIYTKLIDSYFNRNSVKNITSFIKIISNKKDFWDIVDERIFSDTAFYGYDVFNARDRERLGIEFEPKPTELYIISVVLSFVFGVVPFLFLGCYFINKAYESYKYNNKFRWINEKRKQPINLTRETEIMPRNPENEPKPGQEIDANDANLNDNGRS